jgi:hypothetical protein
MAAAFTVRILPAASGLLAAASLALPLRAGEPGIDPAAARRCFAEAAALSKADGGRLWGRTLYGPMLFVDPSTRAVVANERDAAGTLRERDGLWLGKLPADQPVANTAFTWDGKRWTMVMWPVPDDRYARGRLLMHELFHRIQDDLGLPAADADNGHLDRRDGRVWLRLEWRALAEALLRPGQRGRAVEDALVFRAYRRSLFPRAAGAERALELNEGLAEYTGLCASGLPADVLADRAAVTLATHEQDLTFVRTFAYASGPAYGLLLDAAGVGWRGGLSRRSDLGDLLAAALSVKVPRDDLAGEARRRADRYDDGRVLAGEARREELSRRQQAEFRDRFVRGPILELPASGTVRYSFNPNEVEALADVGTVYLTARVSDAWGTLTVTSGGALMERDAAGRVKCFRVAAPADAAARPLKGSGWTLELRDGWGLRPGTRRGDWEVRSAR